MKEKPVVEPARPAPGHRFCDVAIAHTRLDELTYDFDPAGFPELAPGDCVRVRLRGKRVSGLVLDIRDRTPLKKTIPVEQLVEASLVRPDLMKLLRWVGSYYFGRMGEVLSRVLPSGICGYGLRRARAPVPSVREGTRPAGLPESLESFLAERRFGVQVCCAAAGQEDVVAGFAGRLLETGSVILLAPELLTHRWSDALAARLGVEPVLVRGDLGHARRKRVWRELHGGSRCLVIGIRSAVFAPVPDLAGVVVLDEHEKVFKEERRPAFHARDVAILRARLAEVPVLLVDRTPSAETWHNLATGQYTRVDDPAAPQPGREVFVVDMRKHHDDVLSPLLVRELERARSCGSALLCLNRKGLSRHVVCAECGFTFRCPACQVAMVLDSAGELACRYCGHTEAAPELCPACRSENFKYRAPGIEMVSREVGRLLPWARVRTVLSDSELPVGADPGTVLVGTKALLGVAWPEPVALVASLSIDDDLCLLDFRSRERTFQTVSALMHRADAAGAHFLVQTRRPDEPAIRRAIEGDTAGFMDSELRLRHELEFPPYRRLALIKLEGQPVPVEEHTGRLCRLLGRATGVEVLGPIPVPGRRQSRQLLVKLPRNTRLDRIVSACEFEAPGVKVKVDVDPLELA